MDNSRRNFLKISSAAIASGAITPQVLAETVGGGTAHDDDWGMLNDETWCTGCKTCQYVCKQRAGFDSAGDSGIYDNPRDLNEKNYTVVKLYPGDEEKGEPYSYYKRNCMHCNDPACASACPVNALVKRDDGPVTYDAGKCIGCRYCMIACPFDVPTFEYSSATPKIQKCDLCVDIVVQGKPTVCSETCPMDAIITGRRKDLIAEAWRRIKSDPDRYEGVVYGEKEVGGTSVLYLAGVPFERLGLPNYDETPLPALPESIQHGIFKYFVTPIALFGMLAVTRGSMMKCDPNEDEECIEE